MTELSVTYLVLAHESTKRVTRLVDKLLDEDSNGQVIVHFDKKSGKTPFKYLNDYYSNAPRCHVLTNRVRCGWGQWSLVEATLRMLRFVQQTRKTDYYYLLSEYCYPTQPIKLLKRYLQDNKGANFIECKDSSWIKDGIREDRYLYRHFLNKRKYPRLHRWTYKCQKWVGLKRQVPKGLTVRFGSQWWCLTQEAVDHILIVESQYRHFFRWVWIADECFFNSLLSTYQSDEFNILTYIMLDRNGRPLIFDDASKISANYYFFRKFL